ncbi:DUF4307 domain-containing protein [Corynebacterium urinipleomorphum]|uniref:DUF4307 domain-containing protein n=1 Tax=Corynebacterium urinipleomorphum TaxID=1852380 RepID=UPI000B356DC3|nr:DUF4307 domain-containing protein [Corynebacterium urinipleomorphum]
MAKPASSPKSRGERTGSSRTRYGSTAATPADAAPSRTVGKIIAVVSVLFLVLILVFVGRYITQRRAEPISASLVAHERIDDTTSRVWFDVSRNDPDVPGYCIITSLNYERAEIGRRDVVLPGGGEEQTRMYVDIPVRDIPVSGGVYGCSTTIPSFLDAGEEYVEAR